MNYPAKAGRPVFPQCKPLAIALRAATLGLSLSFVAPAYVQANNANVSTQIQLFDIPASALDKALEQFARTAGANLNYNPEQLKGKQAPALTGSYDSSEALNTLLDGTGLMAIPNASGYDVKLANTDFHVLNTINVFGRQNDDTVVNIPQTITVYGEEAISLTSADSVGDMLDLVSGASRSGSSLDMFADDYLIRGFDAEQSANGLGFRQADHPTDLANVERIEVLKGPSSVLYGQMEPGGTVNVVTKQPLNDYQGEASMEYGSYDKRRATLDVTGPISDSVRARLNLAYQEGDSSVDSLDYRRVFVAPNVTMDLTETTNLTIEGSYSANDWTAIQGGTPIQGAIEPNPNGSYAKSFNPGWKDSFTERDSKDINVRLTQAITDKIDARASYSYTRNDANWVEYVPFGLSEDDFRTLDRIIFAGKDTYKKDHELILDLSGELATGALTHKFIVGLNYRDSKVSRPNQLYSTDSIDLYNPQYTAANLSTDNLFRDRTLHQDDKAISAFAQDRITIDDIHLLAGFRYTDSEQSQVTINHLSGSSETDSLSQTDWSTQLGIIYDLTETTSLYANRSESFVPQQGTTSGKKPLEAEESTQYEAGLRFDLGELRINFAGFIIKKENIAIEDPLDDNFEVAQGSAQSKGVELSIGGHVTPDWYFNAAYGYTDTEILDSDDAELEGNRFANIPLHTVSLQSRYHINAVPGLSVGGTVRYSGNRFGDDSNSFELPSYTRLDLTANYAISDDLQANLMIDNVLDEEIFSPGAFDGVVREPERTYTARLKYTF